MTDGKAALDNSRGLVVGTQVTFLRILESLTSLEILLFVRVSACCYNSLIIVVQMTIGGHRFRHASFVYLD